MKVQALRSFYGSEGHVRRGTVIDVTDYRGAALLKRGLVTEVQLAEAAGGGAERPTDGGRTGAARTASSSRRVQAPKARRSKSRKVEQK